MTDMVEYAVIETMDTGVVAITRHTTPKGDTLTPLQSAVGGLVEALDLHHPVTGSIATLWMNEEGKGIGLPANDFAIVLAVASGWLGYFMGDYIAGNVALTGFNPETGETETLDREWLDLIATIAQA